MTRFRALMLALSLFVFPVAMATPASAATTGNYVCHKGQYSMGTLQIMNAGGGYISLPPYKCSHQYVGFEKGVVAFRSVRSTCRPTSYPWGYMYPALQWNWFKTNNNVWTGYINCMI